jgi:hypothetical protein
MNTDLRSAMSSADRDYPPGSLAGVKRDATSDPGYPQPQAAEVESARLLANDARQALLAAGFSDEDIDRLADDFIAEDRGQDTERFIDWARHVQRAAARAARGSAESPVAARTAGGSSTAPRQQPPRPNPSAPERRARPSSPRASPRSCPLTNGRWRRRGHRHQGDWAAAATAASGWASSPPSRAVSTLQNQAVARAIAVGPSGESGAPRQARKHPTTASRVSTAHRRPGSRRRERPEQDQPSPHRGGAGVGTSPRDRRPSEVRQAQ